MWPVAWLWHAVCAPDRNLSLKLEFPVLIESIALASSIYFKPERGAWVSRVDRIDRASVVDFEKAEGFMTQKTRPKQWKHAASLDCPRYSITGDL